MPRTPSGKTMTHSSFSSMWMQLAGVPTMAPPRASAVLMKGRRGTKYSAIWRAMRGGCASISNAAVSIAPSKGSWPAWFATTSTRPGGSRSMSKVSQRK